MTLLLERHTSEELDALWGSWFETEKVAGVLPLPTLDEMEASAITKMSGTLTTVTTESQCTYSCCCGTSNCTSKVAGSCWGTTRAGSECYC